MNNPIYTVSSVEKRVLTNQGEDLSIIKDATFSIEKGQSIAIVGASGSGKSTLLHLLGLLDTSTSGSILYKGKDTATFTVEEKANLHRNDIGFIFQFHHLLSEFTTLENVSIHARLAGYSEKDSMYLACKALDDVGLSPKIMDRVTTLSGGEKQRVSIARAIVTKPCIILADEPTGSLDSESAGHVTELLSTLQKNNTTALVLVTHNTHLAKAMDACYVLEAGVLRNA